MRTFNKCKSTLWYSPQSSFQYSISEVQLTSCLRASDLGIEKSWTHCCDPAAERVDNTIQQINRWLQTYSFVHQVRIYPGDSIFQPLNHRVWIINSFLCIIIVLYIKSYCNYDFYFCSCLSLYRNNTSSMTPYVQNSTRSSCKNMLNNEKIWLLSRQLCMQASYSGHSRMMCSNPY